MKLNNVICQDYHLLNLIQDCADQEKDIIPPVQERINHYLQNSFLPPFPLKEEDVISDTHPKEIIVETLCHETMVMLGS